MAVVFGNGTRRSLFPADPPTGPPAHPSHRVLTLFPSSHRVTMTMTVAFCSQIILQKSSTVSSLGPRRGHMQPKTPLLECTPKNGASQGIRDCQRVTLCGDVLPGLLVTLCDTHNTKEYRQLNTWSFLHVQNWGKGWGGGGRRMLICHCFSVVNFAGHFQ